MLSFIQAGKNYTAEFLRCGLTNTRESVWSIACKTDAQNFMWGNGVKITGTDNREEGILQLCEVQIYAETYGKMPDNPESLWERQIAALAIVNFGSGFLRLSFLCCFSHGAHKWRYILDQEIRRIIST